MARADDANDFLAMGHLCWSRRCGVLGHEGDFVMLLACGFNGDLDVLAEGSEKVHEAFDGKGAGAVTQSAASSSTRLG